MFLPRPVCAGIPRLPIARPAGGKRAAPVQSARAPRPCRSSTMPPERPRAAPMRRPRAPSRRAHTEQHHAAPSTAMPSEHQRACLGAGADAGPRIIRPCGAHVAPMCRPPAPSWPGPRAGRLPRPAVRPGGAPPARGFRAGLSPCGRGPRRAGPRRWAKARRPAAPRRFSPAAPSFSAVLSGNGRARLRGSRLRRRSWHGR